jgi:hypothetical protein
VELPCEAHAGDKGDIAAVGGLYRGTGGEQPLLLHAIGVSVEDSSGKPGTLGGGGSIQRHHASTNAGVALAFDDLGAVRQGNLRPQCLAVRS